MEITTGTKVTIKHIFLDNNNWWRFCSSIQHLLRPAIIKNVMKMLACRTSLMGYSQYLCTKCKHIVKVKHSCKSRFCSSCGKKATDQWLAANYADLPDTVWQHITFTLPCEYREFFWYNRYLMNEVPKIAAGIIKELASSKKAVVGIYLAIHTFGRDLKRNYHIHLSVTCAGLSIDNKKLIKLYFDHQRIKNMWKYRITALLRSEYKSGRLILPKTLGYINNVFDFNTFLDELYEKPWVVHLKKQSNNHKHNIEYAGKYLKRPPIGETRIKGYDGNYVIFEYVDHYSGFTKRIKMAVKNFIARLISHIPDINFRVIRYYGFLSNRTRPVLLPIFKKLLGELPKKAANITFRSLFMKAFGIDPALCPNCETVMTLSLRVFGKSILNWSHRNIALGLVK